MLIDLQNNAHRELLEAMLLRRVPACQNVLSIEQLTGGASRQMFKARVETGEQEMVLVLRRLSGSAKDEHKAFERLSLPQEAVVIKTVRQAGVTTPQIYFEFEPEDDIGEGYAMAFLVGESLGGRIAKSKKFTEARQRLTEQCGQMLGKIHSVDVENSELSNRLPILTAERAVDQMYRVYRSTNIDVPLLEYTAHWLRIHLPPPVKPVLTHGDYRNGNFLVDPQKGLITILDWEMAALADPMRDLAWLCLNPWRYGVSQLPVGGFGSLEALFQAYEAEVGYAIDQDRFKFWQVYGCFWWAIACMMMGLSYRQLEGQLGDRIAIGRRSSEGLIDLVNLLMPGPIAFRPPVLSSSEKEVATLTELVQASQKDLLTAIAPAVSGKSLFVTRVAISNLGIALREIEQGIARDQAEVKSANLLMQTDFNHFLDCRQALCDVLRQEKLALDQVALESHLRNCTAWQIGIDQPTYSGLQVALSGTEAQEHRDKVKRE